MLLTKFLVVVFLLKDACYSYSTGEAVQALYASTYSVPPFELSTQQIVDHMPIMFDYKNLNRKKDKVDCYYSNHPHTLQSSAYFAI